MKKYIFLFLSTAIMFACNSRKKQIDTWNHRTSTYESSEKITQFEEILGKESSKTLNYLVDNFEVEYLKKEYPSLNLKDAYRQLIIDTMKDGGEKLSSNISQNGIERFKNSTLRLEMYKVPDSVWFEKTPNNLFYTKTRYKSLSQDGTFQTTIQESFILHKLEFKDSILQSEMNFVSMNTIGSYKRAFETVFQKKGFVKDYLEYSDVSGSFNPSIFASRIIDSDVEFDDYFIKRLILTTLVY